MFNLTGHNGMNLVQSFNKEYNNIKNKTNNADNYMRILMITII